MINVISLNDFEEDTYIEVSVDSECSGVLVYCRSESGQMTSMLFDSRLFKKFCNDASSAIEQRAQKQNNCGRVKWTGLFQ